MLLDRAPDVRRLTLASRFKISVVAETAEGELQLMNPAVEPALQRVFSGSAAQA
jgi:hypothetical protein